MSTPPARWELAAPASLPELRRICAEAGVSPMLAQVLHARGYASLALGAPLRLSPNPALHQAARQLQSAIAAGRRIRIHGDYDADGVTATALLVRGLRELGADVHGFIPHRLNEGYGVHPGKVPEHAGACELLLTVDCGVTNLEEVRALVSRGVEVIVTDHHSPGPGFPDCTVVHPALTPDYCPSTHNLTGAGVAYHLLWALREALGKAEPRPLAALATLGTIADVAPLTGENRALVKAGLEELARTSLPGLRALMTPGQAPSARDVAFMLAPRINAAGRMGQADLALELLETDSPARALALAALLETHNEERKRIQERMFKEALEVADPQDPVLVVTHENWHAGIMGIVASKLLETHYKPVYIVAQGKGSVRSTPGISAVEGLYFASEHLKRFGGHPGAAGFSLKEGHFGALRERLHAYGRQFPRPQPRVTLEAPLPPLYPAPLLAAEVEGLAPFGQGFASPRWHVRGELQSPKVVGKNRNVLQFNLRGLRGVQFGLNTPPDVNTLGGNRDVCAELGLSSFRGDTRAEYRLEGSRPAAPLTVGGDAAPPLRRLTPQEGVQRLHAGAAAIASGAVARHLQETVPDVRILQKGEAAGEVVAFDLPDGEWLARLLRGGAQVALAWGPNTLKPLLTPPCPLPDGDAGTLAYHRFQWAHAYRTLDAAGFAAAAAGLLGLGAEAQARASD